MSIRRILGSALPLSFGKTRCQPLSRVVIGYATHVEDCVSVLPDAASDILNHLDLISYPPDMVVDALPIRLRRFPSHRVSLRLLLRMAQEDES
jgi:hypothetical protein